MLKLHKNTVEAIVNTLELINKGKYANHAVANVLKSNAKWGGKDRRFIAESVYDIIRWHRLLAYTIDPIIEIVVNQWQIVAAWLVINNNPLPDWEEFSGINIDSIIANHAIALTIRKIRESIPDWLDTMAYNELPNIWDSELKFLNQQAQVVLRANKLKTTPARLQKELREAGIDTTQIPQFPNALVLEKRQNVLQIAQYLQGNFEIQDAGSQLIAPYLSIENNMCVIDACAGAGGKTLHLAALMQNTGKIIALDTEIYKLTELKKRALRAGVSNLITKLIDSNTIQSLANTADRLLLDVPCSGIGVLRRNPDAKWKLSANFMMQVRKTQSAILQNYPIMLRVGGIMVYATCSILPSENQQQVQKFLQNNPTQYQLEKEITILPSQGFDGYYMAQIRKIN